MIGKDQPFIIYPRQSSSKKYLLLAILLGIPLGYLVFKFNLLPFLGRTKITGNFLNMGFENPVSIEISGSVTSVKYEGARGDGEILLMDGKIENITLSIENAKVYSYNGNNNQFYFEEIQIGNSEIRSKQPFEIKYLGGVYLKGRIGRIILENFTGEISIMNGKQKISGYNIEINDFDGEFRYNMKEVVINGTIRGISFS